MPMAALGRGTNPLRGEMVPGNSRKLPMVLNIEEVARLLAAAKHLKHRAALAVAYGAGLRVAEVASLKVGDIDSACMLTCYNYWLRKINDDARP